jgi:Transposase DDE domain
VCRVRSAPAAQARQSGAPSATAISRASQSSVLQSTRRAPPLHDECLLRGVSPVIAIKDTGAVQKGAAKTPCCEHGAWTFAGADYNRRATKWRCPTGKCKPGSKWIKASRLHPLIPRESKRFKDLYRKRGSIEREFGRLKHEWALLPLRVRGIGRVQLHADLTILAKLACALSKARALPLAA